MACNPRQRSCRSSDVKRVYGPRSRVISHKPLSVGVLLLDLPARRHQPDLFERQKRQKLSPLIDQINNRYGRGAVALGCRRPTCGRSEDTPHFIGCPEAWEFSPGLESLPRIGAQRG